MPQKRVSALAAGINAARLVAGGDQMIDHITNDSRQVRPGSLYAALPGDHVDGHDYIGNALESGARAILCSRPPSGFPGEVALLQSPAVRLALSQLSDLFFGNPSDRLPVIGVTGTDGKTSSVYFMHQLLEACGLRSAFLSTAAMQIGSDEEANRLHQSTPEAPVIHGALDAMLSAGNDIAVLESTSHGLSARTCRLAHVAYRAAVLTNVTHEHLEFHGTYERYRDEKANLFRALDTGRYGNDPAFESAAAAGGAAQSAGVAANAGANRNAEASSNAGVKANAGAAANGGTGQPITEWGEHARVVQESGLRFGAVNMGSPEAAFFAGVTGAPVFGYGMDDQPGALRATAVRPDATGSSFLLECGDREIQTRLAVPGVFNIENVLSALLTVALASNTDPIELAPALSKLRAVRGRMNVVCSSPFAVIVDYAHTPGSFERALPFFRGHTTGKLIVVFGSAGERDREKRPIQGAIADRYADIIILADEDPRGEAPMGILAEIAAGCPGRAPGETIHLIPDRTEAIQKALSLAGPGDTVLLLGKGHETSIIGPDGAAPWDEEATARDELARLNIDSVEK